MQRLRIAAIISTVVVAMTAAPAVANAPTQATATELQAHLLQLSDLPPGWTIDTTALPPPSQTKGFCNGPDLASIRNEIPNHQSAGMAYVDDRSNARLGESLISYPTIKAAKRYMSILAAIPKRCREWNGTGGSRSTQHFTVARESATKAGDQSVALRIVASPLQVAALRRDQPAPDQLIIELAAVRIGPVIQGITTSGLGLTVSPALTARYVTAALKRAAPLVR